VKLKITLTKSSIGSTPKHRQTLQALGLRRIGSNTVKQDIPAVQGMIRKCAHLLTVEKITE
jgi:large subunit ribosomal protein L30